ncbi:hypothetical protein HYPSUDRAFT_69517 [Hypholoma sublateritium FD-334 SS-4]|uniref:Uncharacterized protein n=1 Tax=Hypholoma sublateritium (strain FD-334 SS-4) TaxID=945553 RepID=A0A0D2NJB2_HYPSF|nr:hypothetical protein HYPSUDRAFT_69517 [Hypholoma sublateritium FD-334 SS-4]
MGMPRIRTLSAACRGGGEEETTEASRVAGRPTQQIPRRRAGGVHPAPPGANPPLRIPQRARLHPREAEEGPPRQ